uniref:Zonular occludens toxin n=1 Tax=Panagrellus redivivus TaxID=6233 RepID=A0A7E4VEE1_PANRE
MASDRSPQEIALADWSMGVQMPYCPQIPLVDMIEPFVDAVVKMINRYCQNPDNCDLVKRVTFSHQNVVMLDGYPKRLEEIIYFRYFVIVPPDAVFKTKRSVKPLLSTKVLAEVMRRPKVEFERLRWNITAEKYPRYDAITTFMNRALIPIGIVAGIFMLFLAYWSSTMSSSSYSSDEGWLVSGATGGKNAALQRTLEIIEEQKYHHEQERRLQMAIERKEALAARIKLAEAGHGELVPNVERIVPGATKTDSTESETTQETDNNLYEDELADTVPEIVIMPARNSIDSNAPHRKVRKGRRLSSYEEAKRKSWGNIGQNNDKKRWKAGSLMLRTFGSKN